MKREFRASDGGRRFRMVDVPDSRFNGRRGELEFPLTDPGSAEPGEGVLWFGPRDNRDGYDYVAPKNVRTR